MQATKISIAVLGLLLAGSFGYAQQASYSIMVSKAEKALFGEEIKAFAQIEADPKKTATIVAPVNGTVQDVRSLVGDTVSVGDVVAGITTDPVLLSQTKAAEDTLRYANEALAHQNSLFAQQLTTRDQVASARRDVAIAEANLAAAKRLGSDRSTVGVKATVAGTLTTVSATPGQQVLQGAAIATITNPRALLIRPGVEPVDSRRIKPGDTVSVVAVAGPSDTSGESVILAVNIVGSTVDPQTRLVPVTIVIAEEQASGFIVGQTVRVVFSSNNLETVAAPRTALEYEGTTPIVFVMENGKAVKREIKLAGTKDDRIYVSGGLKEGERVITGGLTGITDGAPVKVTPK